MTHRFDSLWPRFLFDPAEWSSRTVAHDPGMAFELLQSTDGTRTTGSYELISRAACLTGARAIDRSTLFAPIQFTQSVVPFLLCDLHLILPDLFSTYQLESVSERAGIQSTLHRLIPRPKGYRHRSIDQLFTIRCLLVLVLEYP